MLVHCTVQVIHIKDFQRLDEGKSSDNNNSLHGPFVGVLALLTQLLHPSCFYLA